MTLVLVVAGLGGCSGYAPPSLSVAGVSVAAESEHGVVIDFAIDAQNVNSVELPLKQVRYSLTLDGREVFSGVRSPEASLRRLGTQRFHIPVAVAVGPEEPKFTGKHGYALQGTLLYITPGQLAEVLFDIKWRRPSVGFREEGTLDFGEKTAAR